MTIEERWKEFVNEIATKIEVYDAMGAMILREHLLREMPPDEESLEWGMASANFNQHGAEFAIVLKKQDREREALLVLTTLRELNMQLAMLDMGTVVPQEFIKEVKLTRPI